VNALQHYMNSLTFFLGGQLTAWEICCYLNWENGELQSQSDEEGCGAVIAEIKFLKGLTHV